MNDLQNCTFAYANNTEWIISQPECYICLCNSIEKPDQELCEVKCHCKGSNKYVHHSCLNQFKNLYNTNHCSICNYNYGCNNEKKKSFFKCSRNKCCFGI